MPDGERRDEKKWRKGQKGGGGEGERMKIKRSVLFPQNSSW